MNLESEYNNTIEWLYNLHLFGIKLGLKKIEMVLEYLGNPQDKLRIIHVGGTNGKGSVCAIISSILASAGYKMGINTSPHLSEFTERIQINGKQISRSEVVEYAKLLKEIRERINSETDVGYATYFEIVTAMALKYFADNEVDFVVLEVGLGGTFDATNIVSPIISIITNISLDHTEHLGNSITSVAKNKAGIIKPNCPLVTSNINPKVLNILKKTCKIQQSPLFLVGKDMKFEIKNLNLMGLRFDYSGLNWTYSDLDLPLLAQHQGTNAALAIAALEILSDRIDLTINENALRLGLKNTIWPGRMEIMQKAPYVILDGAHNPAGANALHEAIRLFDYEKLILVFGCSEEKEIKNLLENLIKLPNKIYLTQANIRRAAEPNAIFEKIQDMKKADKTINPEIIITTPVKEAVKNALFDAHEKDLVCICGSLFVVGEARELWVDLEVMDNKCEKLNRIHY